MTSLVKTAGAAFFDFLTRHKSEFNYDEKKGTCDYVPFDRLSAEYPHLTFFTSNGGSWWRKSSSAFKGHVVNPLREKNKTVAIQLGGTKREDATRRISSAITKQLRNEPCVVTACTPSEKCQIDHKNGRYTEDSLNKVEEQSLDEFQPMHPVINTIKREHCKKCSETNNRFDARALGHSVGWTMGDVKYKGSCIGCYWHDPISFNASVTKATNEANSRDNSAVSAKHKG